MGVLAKAAGSLWDWIEAGYPEEVAKRIVSGELPMDEASRMARAAEQGYGDVLHRGHSNQSVPHSDQDMWLSDSHYVAQTYADAHGAAGKVTPLRTNADYHGPNNLAYVRGDGEMHDKVTTNSIKNPGIRQGIIKGTDDIAEAVKESGQYQGTHFRSIKDEFHTASSTEPSDVYNILGSRPDVNIRHADAAYDPKYTGPNIMGGVLAGGVGLGALSQSEDADAGFVTRGGKTLLEAWHGSPHKFDRFSMDAIGTGEGAQAYGHGLYFADSEDVARSYRDALTAQKNLGIPKTRHIADGMTDAERSAVKSANNSVESTLRSAGVPHKNFGQPWRTFHDYYNQRNDIAYFDDLHMKQRGPQVEARIKELSDKWDADPEFRRSMQDINGAQEKPDWGWMRHPYRTAYKNAGKHFNENAGGALYRTEIDVTPESLLDWDAMLDEQPKAVQEALESTDWWDYAAGDLWSFEDNPNGGSLVRWLSDDGPEFGSQQLNDAGIKGIKYLDGDSRAVGNGTSNYVIFDDSLINIAERGNATVPALGVLATGTGAALAAPALKSEGLEKATGFLDETIRSARHAAGPFSFLVPYEGISNFAKKWNADEDLTWRDYLGLLDF